MKHLLFCACALTLTLVALAPADEKLKGDAVRVRRFGGEGTGGQSFFDYEWKVGETYRFLVTAKPDGDTRTAYSGYFFVPEKAGGGSGEPAGGSPVEGQWKHLVTFSTI